MHPLKSKYCIHSSITSKQVFVGITIEHYLIKCRGVYQLFGFLDMGFIQGLRLFQHVVCLFRNYKSPTIILQGIIVNM